MLLLLLFNSMQTKNIKNFFQNPFNSTKKEVEPKKAYDLWAENYDNENGNLMLYFDRILFEDFLAKANLTGKRILDFGCGTGRYWNELLKVYPEKLIGCDISESMINKLKKKFPHCETYIIKNNNLDFLSDLSFDFIISTLVIAHIQNIKEIAGEWNRLLKKEGEIFITDFHPQALNRGAKRTFNNNGKKITIKNFIHPVKKVESLFLSLGFEIVDEEEKIIDENVKEFYEEKNALNIYEEYKNIPMIYSLHLKK